ncbi:MAG TPA: PsiF family protein [Steroidobacteraceae bacterium]|nr:PsiF family protein [Steroidobacteraceae bacterium]
MRSLALVLVAATLSLSLQPTLATTSQQDKTEACNANAAQKQLRGEARKLYMKGCVGARKEAATQQAKAKQCSADATTQRIKGDARRNFIKQCLGGHNAAA